MQEMAKPRDTFMLIRGQYDKHGDKVTPGVPAALPPLPAGAPANRLGLAHWLVDPAHPLIARVTVNRYWQMFFGTAWSRRPRISARRANCPAIRNCSIGWPCEFREPAAADGGTPGRGT